jgi:hypothetical protein
VVRLELNAEDFPSTLPVTELVTTIDYARTRLDDNSAPLLPESAEMRLVKYSGEIERNRIEFTHCRVFGADSTVDFSPPGSSEQTPPFGVASTDDTLRSLPGGLQIAVTLRSRISEDMAVGALIDGVVAGNVTAKGAVVIAAGSPVRGRIRRLERYTDPFLHFVLGLEFTEVEVQGIRHRFYADVVHTTDGVPRQDGGSAWPGNQRDWRDALVAQPSGSSHLLRQGWQAGFAARFPYGLEDATTGALTRGG